MASLDAVKEKLLNDEYSSEYEFELALSNITLSAHDGHFQFPFDGMSVFYFSPNTSLALASVSTNGTDLPLIYLYGKQKSDG